MATTRRRLRLSVQAKVLFVVLGFLVLLPLLMVWIVDRQTSQLVQEQARQSLTTAGTVLGKSLDNRYGAMMAGYRNNVVEPSFKAAYTQTHGDAATMNAYLRSLLDRPGEEAEVLLVYHLKGELLASVRREASFPLADFERAAAPLAGAAFEGEAGVDNAFLHDRAYAVVAMPISLGEGGPVVGVLVAGIRTTEDALRKLKDLTRTEIVLVEGNRVVVSTLSDSAGAGEWLGKITPATRGASREVARVVVGGEHFMAIAGEEAGGAVCVRWLRRARLSSRSARRASSSARWRCGSSSAASPSRCGSCATVRRRWAAAIFRGASSGFRTTNAATLPWRSTA
jgi:hypothetical protein